MPLVMPTLPTMPLHLSTAAGALLALVLLLPVIMLMLRPRTSSLLLSSWPQPLWLYLQALAAVGKKGSKKGPGKAIQVILSRPVRSSPARLRRYLALAGFPEGGSGGSLPLMYPMVEGFRLVMQCMLLPAFPVNVLGSVLGGTRVLALRQLGAEEKLMYSCRVDPAFRTTPKGDTELDITLEAHATASAPASSAPASSAPASSAPASSAPASSAPASSAPASSGYELVWRCTTTVIILSPR
ncbi:hypothetical protein Agub_g3223, partial [Astrephomene gubernaculifera]